MCGCGSEIIRKCLSFHLAHAKYNTLSGEANAYRHTQRHRSQFVRVCVCVCHSPVLYNSEWRERKGNCRGTKKKAAAAAYCSILNACVYSSEPNQTVPNSLGADTTTLSECKSECACEWNGAQSVCTGRLCVCAKRTIWNAHSRLHFQ